MTGPELAAARKARGLSRHELARFAAVDVHTLSRWEKGGTPRPSTLRKVTLALSRYVTLPNVK